MKRAFTLIELLVVITIIVVLLALLTPALDRAIYQAELAVCAANQDAVATGALVYAAANKRRYPNSQNPRATDGGYQPDTLGREDSQAANDLRPAIDGVIPLKLLQDPLTGEIDLSYEGNEPTTWVYSTYDLWFGFFFRKEGQPEAGMHKMGDRFAYTTDHDGDGSADRFRYNLLASDKHIANDTDGQDQAGHPDHDGVMTNVVYQDQESLPALGALERVTTSRWYSDTRRGPVDLNFAADDGSVFRFNDVQIDDRDARVKPVPAHSADTFAPKWLIWVPPAGGGG